MNRTATVMVALALCAAGTAVAAEKVYRWVDEQGGVHFSASPPPGVAVPPTDLHYTPTPDPDAASRQLQQYQQNAVQRREDAAKAAADANKAGAEAGKRAAACEQARGILDRLRNGRPMTRYRNADGSYAPYDDDMREQKIAEAEASAAANCD